MNRFPDRLRREAYLLRLSWHLQDYPRAGRLKRELRREVTAAAADGDMRTALAQLGHPRALAARYMAELGRPAPRYGTGAVWGGLGAGALLYLVAAYVLGTMETLEQTGGGTLTRTVLGAPTTFVATDAVFGVEFGTTWWTVLAYALAFGVPFALGSRLWRVWTGRSSAADG